MNEHALPVVLPRARPAEDQATRLRALVDASRPAAVAVGAAGGGGPSVRPQAPAPVASRAAGPRARVVTISSGKGGVGKTNLSVNLSIALAAAGRKTTLLDADLGLANADLLCGLTPARRLDRFVGIGDGNHPELSPRRGVAGGGLVDLALDAPGGFRLVPGAAGVSRMADLSSQEQARLLGGIADLERTADVLVIDTAAGLGRDVLSMIRIADLALVVATPEPTSIADAYALIKCAVIAARERGAHGLREAGHQSLKLTLVVNQAAGAKEAAGVHARIAGVCRKFLGYELPLLGWVPHDVRVGDAVRKRRPLMLEHPGSAAARAVSVLAGDIGRRLELGSAVRGGRGEGLSDMLARLIMRGRSQSVG